MTSSSRTEFAMKETNDQNESKKNGASFSSEAGATSKVAVSPSIFYQSPIQRTASNLCALKNPKTLPKPLLSGSFIPLAPSGVFDRNRISNDDSTEKDPNSGSKAAQQTNEDANTTKRKATRVSIGGMSNEGKSLGGSITTMDSSSTSNSKAEGEPIPKKQKTNPEIKNESSANKEDSTNGNTDDCDDDCDDDGGVEWTAVWEEATSVSPMFVVNGEDEDENPYQESIHQLEKWTKEFLELKKKLETARLQNAILLNKLYEVGANRDDFL